MKDVMVDCETFGLHSQSVICSIGAVAFDPYKVGAIGAHFHQGINLKSSMQHGRVVDPDTVLWWLQNSDAARGALVEKLQGGKLMNIVLDMFTTFLRSCGTKEEVTVWSCGSRDFEWLEDSYAALGRPVPWRYRTMDYRTIRELFGTPGDEPPAGTSHDALSDAKWQALYLQNVLARLRTQADLANQAKQMRQGDPLARCDFEAGFEAGRSG